MDRSTSRELQPASSSLGARTTKIATHRRRVRRVVVRVALASLAALVSLWIAVGAFPGLGPWLANALRTMVGARAVAVLEDVVYGIEDRWNRLTRRREAPKSYWEAPAKPSPQIIPPELPSPEAPSAIFRPIDVGPMHARVAAPGDGVWVAVVDPEHAAEPPLMYKTLLHPDATRPWAELFVVAIDLGRVRVFAVAGSEDPEALTRDGRQYDRPALVPAERQPALVAAFNGGWKTEHGQHGMKVDGIVLIPPKERACTIAAYDDDSLRIATWATLAGDEAQMRWWRQTPACLIEGGSLHAGLSREETPAWGAAVGGDTIIRRSALGLDTQRVVLFMAVSNATSAPALAEGMRHAGASDVAELDVNWSFPKFLVYRHNEQGLLVAQGLFKGFVLSEDEYVRQRAKKDFFYIVRRSP